ncbi:MAG TPA: DUF2382 domain-containing protein [Chloroflexota bacterium]|nr:DUF2382 domain-containing protein [Chloroflexota bacterium]
MAEFFNPATPEPRPAAWADAGGATYSSADLPPEGRTIPLRREELVAQREMRHMGDVEVRTEVEEVPGRIEVQAQREEVEVEHVPVGRVVTEREAPYQDGDVLVVPVYEEQLVVSKRLLLREELRIKRVPSTETRVFEDTLRRERVVLEDAEHTGALRERYPTDDSDEERHEGFLGNLRRKVMQP